MEAALLNHTGTGRVRTAAGCPKPQPGDLCVVHGYSWTSRDIRIAEYLACGRRSPWNHVCVASGYANGQLMIVEAQPGGAVEVPWHYARNMHRWSTGVLPDCPAAANAAIGYVGTGYSYADYVAIGTHRWHLPGAVLWKDFVADTGHMICSQLAARARFDAGKPLWPGEWTGYDMPSDIGFLLG